MLSFSRRMIIMKRFREYCEQRHLRETPEMFLTFLNEIGIIDEARATSFVLYGNADIVTWNFKEEEK